MGHGVISWALGCVAAWQDILRHSSLIDSVSLPELRDAGNKLYQAKKFPQAIAKYTRSAQFAPPKTEALSLAFANRSAVLFQAKFVYLI